ncbi:hypothetical protein [Limnohabitans sp. Rim8]|uniref:hypothetical protein n=1 Tax=Limnohabitans sp. Rim8 TaxID=1100718 RepID=UPI0025DFBFDD|nr:hypothetical protein [Limnohabitans sp. Rim8]
MQDLTTCSRSPDGAQPRARHHHAGLTSPNASLPPLADAAQALAPRFADSRLGAAPQCLLPWN